MSSTEPRTELAKGTAPEDASRADGAGIDNAGVTRDPLRSADILEKGADRSADIEARGRENSVLIEAYDYEAETDKYFADLQVKEFREGIYKEETKEVEIESGDVGGALKDAYRDLKPAPPRDKAGIVEGVGAIAGSVTADAVTGNMTVAAGKAIAGGAQIASSIVGDYVEEKEQERVRGIDARPHVLRIANEGAKEVTRKILTANKHRLSPQKAASITNGVNQVFGTFAMVADFMFAVQPHMKDAAKDISNEGYRGYIPKPVKWALGTNEEVIYERAMSSPSTGISTLFYSFLKLIGSAKVTEVAYKILQGEQPVTEVLLGILTDFKDFIIGIEWGKIFYSLGSLIWQYSDYIVYACIAAGFVYGICQYATGKKQIAQGEFLDEVQKVYNNMRPGDYGYDELQRFISAFNDTEARKILKSKEALRMERWEENFHIQTGGAIDPRTVKKHGKTGPYEKSGLNILSKSAKMLAHYNLHNKPMPLDKWLGVLSRSVHPSTAYVGAQTLRGGSSGMSSRGKGVSEHDTLIMDLRFSHAMHTLRAFLNRDHDLEEAEIFQLMVVFEHEHMTTEMYASAIKTFTNLENLGTAAYSVLRDFAILTTFYAQGVALVYDKYTFCKHFLERFVDENLGEHQPTYVIENMVLGCERVLDLLRAPSHNVVAHQLVSHNLVKWWDYENFQLETTPIRDE